MYDTNMENIGKMIKYYRKSANISIEDLGKAIGKSKTTVARYENNEIILDIPTVIDICNVFNIDFNDICTNMVHTLEKECNKNPFDTNLLYLYYISKNGIVISSLEITQNKYSNYVLMKNGLTNHKYKQEYNGVLESSYNTAFICLTNAINNPGLDKFQIEIDLHSKKGNRYYGMFLGVANYTHKPTARKCIISKELITSEQCLLELFEELKVTSSEIESIANTKYWDMLNTTIEEYVINL